MMEGGDERDRWGVGSGGEGGQGCSHDSLTPSFTVSQRIKCQTNQLSSKQTSTGTGHDGIYLPRVHINKIKKRYHTKSIVLKQPASPHHQASLLPSPSFVLWLVIQSVVNPLASHFIASLSVASDFLCLIDVQPTRFAGIWGNCTAATCVLYDNITWGEKVQLQLTGKHPPIHTHTLNLTLSYHSVWPKWPSQTH